MAKARTAAPASKVYVGMLATTVFAMFVGILLLSLEANEYDWESQAKGSPVNIPKVDAPRLPGSGTPEGGTGTTPAGGMGLSVPPALPAIPVTPANDLVRQPSPAPEEAPKPAIPAPTPPATATTKQPEETPPATITPEPPRGPRPGFNARFPRGKFPSQPAKEPEEKK